MESERDRVFSRLREITGKNPVWIVGTGAPCGVSTDFGMPALAKHLIEAFDDDGSWLADEKQAWDAISNDLSQNPDLETALQKNKVPDGLMRRIVAKTGDFVASIEKQSRVAGWGRTSQPWPLEGLLRAMQGEANESDEHAITIVTTNYDCLIEHACDRLQLPVCTGFVGRISCRYDWGRAIGEMRELPSGSGPGKVKSKQRWPFRPHVRLLKPHGSLDWFERDGETWSDPSRMYEPNTAKEPRKVITPGLQKYEEGFKGRHFDMFSHCRSAFNKAGAFLFIGYGFNDSHVNDASNIESRLKAARIPGLIITHSLSDQAMRLLQECPRLWAVSSDKSNGAIVQQGTVIKFKDPAKELWKIDQYVTEVLE